MLMTWNLELRRSLMLLVRGEEEDAGGTDLEVILA